ncbi:DUF2336 domain-containing protein [Asticcacaulis sp. BYS171W]|uniref:DUF2336 domain-containing protein n=1 Tax=Asticcacaulis aquaticus TaxID=2984212 RepID=A0ABT5HV94_9CAUL|nr:DUF2336 domain-containing protein [Asticcacaulis aquaticus]MDC7683889.1 DUF2336 domain-containing protein [Asticcacaulis aquaticus]
MPHARPAAAFPTAATARAEVRAPQAVPSSTLQPLTQVRTLLRLMQLNAMARRLTGPNETPTPASHHTLALRLGELILDLNDADRFPILTELSRADWAEPLLIAALCRLPVESSAALILHSPVLSTGSLRALIAEGPEDKAILAARRPDLDAPLIGALLDLNVPAVNLALLNNGHAPLSTAHLDRLIAAARDDIGLRSALVRHPALSHRQACALLGLVGPRLRDDLNGRFEGLYATDFTAPVPVDEAQTLHRLQQGDFAGFCTGLARATGLEPGLIRRALREVSGVPLALLLTVAGIDRAAFPTLLTRLQAVNDSRPRVAPAHWPWLRHIFDLTPDEARARLTAILAVPT